MSTAALAGPDLDARYTVGVTGSDLETVQPTGIWATSIGFAPMAPRPEIALGFTGFTGAKTSTTALGIRLPITPNVSVAAHGGFTSWFGKGVDYHMSPSLDGDLSWLLINREGWDVGLSTTVRWTPDQVGRDEITAGLGAQLRFGR
jgi:hypothetical protein